MGHRRTEREDERKSKPKTETVGEIKTNRGAPEKDPTEIWE